MRSDRCTTAWIVDSEAARGLLRVTLRQVVPHWWDRLGLRVVLGVPGGAGTQERQALRAAARAAGVARVTLLPEPIAGALGCGLDPLEPRVHLVVDVGGGTAEAMAFCFGGVVVSRDCRIAGDEMTLAMHHYLRRSHQLLVGDLIVEDTKIHISSETEATVPVAGREAATGQPHVATVSVEELIDATTPVTDTIVATLVACLDELPPQGVADVMDAGVLVFGGGSLLRGFPARLERALGFTVKQADEPLTCVAQGAALALNNSDVLRAYGDR